MQSSTDISLQLQFTTLCHEFAPSEVLTPQEFNPPKLFNISKDIIARVSAQTNTLGICLFNVPSRKRIYKKILHNPSHSLHQGATDPIMISLDNNQHILIIRTNTTVFLFYSLKLQVLFELNVEHPPNPALVPLSLCYADHKVITWFNNGDELTYWKLFESKPYDSIKLPFCVMDCYSLLPNRNLLILQFNERTKLLCVDIKKNQVVKTTNIYGDRLQKIINTEDRVMIAFNSYDWSNPFLKFSCHLLTPELELKDLGMIIVYGHSSQMFAICGGSYFFQNGSGGKSVVKVGTEKKVSQKISWKLDKLDKLWESSAELRNQGKHACLFSKTNKFFVLKITEIKSLGNAFESFDW